MEFGVGAEFLRTTEFRDPLRIQRGELLRIEREAACDHLPPDRREEGTDRQGRLVPMDDVAVAVVEMQVFPARNHMPVILFTVGNRLRNDE